MEADMKWYVIHTYSGYENKVMTRPIWQQMYRLSMYQHCYRDAQKNAEYLEERIVNIPSSVRLTK